MMYGPGLVLLLAFTVSGAAAMAREEEEYMEEVRLIVCSSYNAEPPQI